MHQHLKSFSTRMHIRDQLFFWGENNKFLIKGICRINILSFMKTLFVFIEMTGHSISGRFFSAHKWGHMGVLLWKLLRKGAARSASCSEVSVLQGRWYSRTELSVSSGGNYSLSDVIIEQPHPVDPSLRVSLHLSPALSCHFFLSLSSRVLGRWEGVIHRRGQIAGLSPTPLFCRMFFSDELDMWRTGLVYNRDSARAGSSVHATRGLHGRL